MELHAKDLTALSAARQQITQLRTKLSQQGRQQPAANTTVSASPGNEQLVTGASVGGQNIDNESDKSSAALTGLIDRIENVSSRNLVIEQEKNAVLMEQIKHCNGGTELLAQADELAQLRVTCVEALACKQDLAEAHTQIEELMKDIAFSNKNLCGAQMELQLKTTGLESSDEPSKSTHQIELDLVKRSNEILGNDYTSRYFTVLYCALLCFTVADCALQWLPVLYCALP